MSMSFLGSGQTILQVAYASGSPNASTTSTSYNTGFGVSSPTITPTSTSSKILVLVNLQGLYNSSTGNGVSVILQRNQSSGGNVFFPLLSNYSSTNAITQCSFAYLDSPATTSSTYYNIVMGVWPAGTAYLGYATGSTVAPQSSITLIEISGV